VRGSEGGRKVGGKGHLLAHGRRGLGAGASSPESTSLPQGRPREGGREGGREGPKAGREEMREGEREGKREGRTHHACLWIISALFDTASIDHDGDVRNGDGGF